MTSYSPTIPLVKAKTVAHMSISISLKTAILLISSDFLISLISSNKYMEICQKWSSVSIANSVTAVTTKEYFIGKAVEYLREDLLKFAEETLTKTITGHQHSKI